MPTPGLPLPVTPDCAEFTSVVEVMLARRRADPARRRAAGSWGAVPRSWTRDELCDVAYSSYRALLRGAVRRLPRREVVLTIADYLECTMIERNQLLGAARYAIEHPGPGGAELHCVIDELGVVITALPLPAYAVSRDWTVQLINDQLLTALGLARAEVAGLPAPSRNVLRLLFDPSLPVRRVLEPDQASWSGLAAFSIVRFRQDNVLWQYDAWYQGLIARLSDLPDFSRYWRQAQRGTGPGHLADPDPNPGGLASVRVTVARQDGRVLRLRPLNISLHGMGYPGIVGFLPADSATSAQLRSLGVPSPANRWGAAGRRARTPESKAGAQPRQHDGCA